MKGVKRSHSRLTSGRSATQSKQRTVAAKSARPKPLAKRDTTKKAPARKATKATSSASPKGKALKSSTKTAVAKKAVPKVAAKTTAKSKVKKPTVTAKPKKAVPSPPPARSRTAKKSIVPAKRIAKPIKMQAVKRPLPAVQQTSEPRPYTIDERAALLAFERAYKEFARGNFAEARDLFRALIEKHTGISDVIARARTYLTITESRLRTETALPKDADSLYDRGVIELNRGEFVAAQEMFERALKREPQGAHIHYGLAATRARLGSIDAALESLHKAIDLQPKLRLRAQHDADLVILRNDPEFDRLTSSVRQ